MTARQWVFWIQSFRPLFGSPKGRTEMAKKHKTDKSEKSKKRKRRPPHVPIYKPTMDRFLKEDEPVGLIALENFYYYTD